MFWLNNSRSSGYKLITKVDKLISYSLFEININFRSKIFII